MHLCPEVKGQASEKGKPLSNVKIERVLNFSDGKSVEDFTYTDNNGGFSLPEINIRSNQPAVPLAEIFTSQAIYLSYNNEEYCLWGSRLSGVKYREEYARKLRQLIADISNGKVLFKFQNKKTEGYKFEALSICRWSDDFEVVEQNAYFDLSEIETDNN